MVCPQKAIRIRFDKDSGLFLPQVDASSCIGCGRCFEGCPSAELPESALGGKRTLVRRKPLAVFASYARDAGLRWNATSGGVISSLIVKLFASGRYSRAYVVEYDNFSGNQAELAPVTDLRGVTAAGKSKYIPVSSARVIAAIREKTIAGSIVVCTPCQLKVMRREMRASGLDDTDVLFIGLFCQSMFNYNIYSHYARAYGRFDRLFFREKEPNGWPGDTTLLTADSRRKVSRRVRMSLKNVYPVKCCGLCSDKLNEDADISVGDCYVSGFSSPDGLKGVSSVVVRTARGQEAFDACRSALVSVPMTYDMVRLSQKTMPTTEFDSRAYVVGIDIASLLNRGQWLMFEAILEQVRGRLPNAIVCVDCRAFAAHTNYFRSKGVLPMLDRGSVDLFLYAPGFKFSDHFSPKGDASAALKRDVTYFQSFSKPGRKVVFMPQAFGPFETSSALRRIREVSRFADLIFARDSVSASKLTAAVGTDDRIVRAPDFTCLYHAGTKAFPLAERTYAVVIPNVQMLLKGSPELALHYRDLLRGLLVLLAKSSVRVVLLNHAGENDDALIAELAGLAGKECLVVGRPTAAEAKNVIAGARLVVSSRYHGLISALTEGVPVLCTSWSHKYREVLAELGCEGNCLDVHHVDLALGTVRAALERPDDFRVREERLESLRAEVYGMWDRIWSVVPDWAFRSCPPDRKAMEALLKTEPPRPRVSPPAPATGSNGKNWRKIALRRPHTIRGCLRFILKRMASRLFGRRSDA